MGRTQDVIQFYTYCPNPSRTVFPLPRVYYSYHLPDVVVVAMVIFPKNIFPKNIS